MARFLRAGGGLQWLSVAILASGIAGTAALSSLTLAVHHRTDQHLLALQVRQAASVVAAAVPVTQTEMEDSLQVARATSSASAFEQFVQARFTSSAGGFRSVSLWRIGSGAPSRLALVGAPPALEVDGRLGFLSTLVPGRGLRITPILDSGSDAAIGYAEMPPDDGGLLVYAEISLPQGRRLVVPHGSPFGDLNFALYLGPPSPADLIEASVPTPIRGSHATATTAFGTSEITVVGTPTTDLGGGLPAALPWLVLFGGLALTLGAAAAAELLGRRRRLAENLAGENQRLYLEQSNIASTFQHALLPAIPRLEGVEAEARYLPGTAGIDVGGDWYDLVSRNARCTFVVGDVSGRGLRAAATMAALRFATRAYIAQGDGPEAVVEKLNRLEEFDGDELFATLLIGEIDIEGRRVRLVNAGHPPPMLITDEAATFLEVPAGPPIGVRESPADGLTVEIPGGATLVAYTDGLIERRDQPIDVGLARLAAVGATVDMASPLGEVLDRMIAIMLPDGPVDDTAMLAVRWPR